MKNIGDKVKVLDSTKSTFGKIGKLIKIAEANYWEIELENKDLTYCQDNLLEKIDDTPRTFFEKISAIVGTPVKIKQEKSTFFLQSKDNPSLVYAKWSMKQLSGCCGVCVSYHAIVNENHRKKGLGTLLNKLRQQMAWEATYTILLCTDIVANIPQQKILNKHGWKTLLEFENRKTKNKVELRSILLEDTGMIIDKPVFLFHIVED
jgi:hypothetical protein